GQLAIRSQEVLFDEVVLAARELIEPLLEQRGQRIDVQLGPGVPVIRGDQQRLTQVLGNLLANASKFGPRDTTITIGANAASVGGLVSTSRTKARGRSTRTTRASSSSSTARVARTRTRAVWAWGCSSSARSSSDTGG